MKYPNIYLKLKLRTAFFLWIIPFLIKLILFKIWYVVLKGLTPDVYNHIVPLDMKGCICHFVKWQIHTFISKGMPCIHLYTVSFHLFVACWTKSRSTWNMWEQPAEMAEPFLWMNIIAMPRCVPYRV